MPAQHTILCQLGRNFLHLLFILMNIILLKTGKNIENKTPFELKRFGHFCKELRFPFPYHDMAQV